MSATPPMATAPDPLERTSAAAMTPQLSSLDYLNGRQFDAFPTSVSAEALAQKVITSERDSGKTLGHETSPESEGASGAE